MEYTAQELYKILNDSDECYFIEAKGGSESSHSVMESVCSFSNEPGLGGGYIANQQRNNKQCKTYNQVTKCEPVYEYVTEDKVVGYRNCAMYNGQKICKETTQPLDYLTITQTVTVH